MACKVALEKSFKKDKLKMIAILKGQGLGREDGGCWCHLGESHFQVEGSDDGKSD